MSRERLIKKGKQITSLDQLYSCDWVIVHGKPYHRGWVSSWQFRMAGNYVKKGIVFEGIRKADDSGDVEQREEGANQ